MSAEVLSCDENYAGEKYRTRVKFSRNNPRICQPYSRDLLEANSNRVSSSKVIILRNTISVLTKTRLLSLLSFIFYIIAEYVVLFL